MQAPSSQPYCVSRQFSSRRKTVEVNVGLVGVGGSNPLRVQSMTTSDTQDVAATVRQCVELAEAGCEIVRITAPNVPAAACLKEIRARFSDADFAKIPLVADIHFLPQAAMEAVEHVEKIRINPGNYADKKKFAVREYSDADYERELQRLHEAVSPLIKRCKQLGRALRIGTNHGSLSDRIMNRFGDSPEGMVESALEFVRICESLSYHEVILSMKASNPKVVIQAYRLLVARLDKAHRPYPLHLGVTEAGDGEDGRIKSAIGIGSLLVDGLGDTLRVSLTEDSVNEIPVARALADKAMSLWSRPAASPAGQDDSLQPFRYQRRSTVSVPLTPGVAAGGENPPRVLVPLSRDGAAPAADRAALLRNPALRDTPAEGLVLDFVPGAAKEGEFADLGFPVLRLANTCLPAQLEATQLPAPALLVRRFEANEGATLADFARFVRRKGLLLAVDAAPDTLATLRDVLRALGEESLLFTFSGSSAPAAGLSSSHALGAYRQIAERLLEAELRAPIWIQATAANALQPAPSPLSRLLEASILCGGLLCDGIGDLISIEGEPDEVQALKLSYNVLQGAGARISKTEYVACPSCGRTLFDLQSTTQRIRSMTGHLKGVKIAIMGCIVNGPGEMADADFGYVGGAPGKINLYVGKNCVQFNIPQAEADSRLIALIKEHGKWADPELKVTGA